ncbi:hypothetical protein CN491_12015 [Bacillus cereus]|uniref:Uncharacterized protein n=1 Tax=Bacillus cereus TaxID=1396 RepID=A0A2A8LPN5_BACCE|nr:MULTISPECIES: hypothetical protein [Bacillus cereus group]MDR4983342.1 hypothetical protein [Bacillus cereus]MEA1008763.1 hypothetical protein [Bacillus cereus]PES95598.1 hypothetical protein CN491_12015 [Bacillus cereus]PFP77360.1 hypothetical protein COJ95_13920 [Bacillus cereus]PGT17048.1 hypothetical protein COC96_17925 [Bacillus cereus]
MKIWKRISDQERCLIPLQPVLWIDGSKKAKELPNVAVTLQIRSMYKEKFSYELIYDVNDILIIQIEVENKGIEMISRVVVSHMIRDYFAYIPNSLKVDKGISEFLFQLVRWRIDNLLPNEKVELICKIKANKDKALKNALFQATYTYQYEGVSYGPLQTNEVVVRQ